MTEHLPQDHAENSLWGESAIADPGYDVLQESVSADVLVVGGGYTGLSCALHLAEQGVEAVLLEARSIGFGGSGRNAGLVNAGVWVNPEHVVAELGEEAGARFNLALRDSPATVFDLVERHALDCQARRVGTVNIAHSAKGFDRLAQRCAQLQALGAGVSLIDGQESARISASTVYRHGGILDPNAGTIHPLSYARSLARTASGLGVRVFDNSAIESLERQGERWCATTASGQVCAEQVVLATNAYADAQSEGVRDSVLPVYIFQCATAPLPAHIVDELIPERQGLWDTQTLMTSSRVDAAGRLIMSSAGRLQGVQRGIREDWMMRNRNRLFPQTAGLPWAYRWSGRVGVTSSKILRIQLIAPGVFAPAGYNGRGIGTGTVIGKHLADAIASGNRDDFPFPIEALYREKWTGMRAGYYSYGSLALQFVDRRNVSAGEKSNAGSAE